MVPKKRSRSRAVALQESSTPTSEETSQETKASPALPPSDPKVEMTNMENSLDDNQIPAPIDPPPQIPLNETKFEKLFYDPQTHVCAVAMLNDHLQSMTKSIPSSSSRQRARSGEEMNLRSRDPKVERQGQSKADTAVAGPSTRVLGTSNEGMAMVKELCNRYETNKRNAKYGSQAKEVKEKINVDPMADDDDFEFDENELDMWDDEDDDPQQKSDFLKYTVPQYDVKLKLCNMHCTKIRQMTPSEVEKACLALLPELRDILNETVFCERHEMFKKSGISKNALRQISVAEPFSSAHDNRVVNVINNVLLADKDVDEFSGELLQYVSHVLVPEALTRIYAKTNKISVEFAEKELRYGAGYDGQVEEELVKTLDNVEVVKTETAV